MSKKKKPKLYIRPYDPYEDMAEMAAKIRTLTRQLEVIKKYHIPTIKNILISLELTCEDIKEISNLKGGKTIN